MGMLVGANANWDIILNDSSDFTSSFQSLASLKENSISSFRFFAELDTLKVQNLKNVIFSFLLIFLIVSSFLLHTFFLSDFPVEINELMAS